MTASKFSKELDAQVYCLLSVGTSMSEESLKEWRASSPHYHLLKEFVEGKISGITLKLALDGISSYKHEENTD